MSETSGTPFKEWYDRKAAEVLADQLSASKEFDRATFLSLAVKDLAKLEMQDRVRQFSDAIAAALPSDRAKALRIVRETLPPHEGDWDMYRGGRVQWPIGHFIEDYGGDHFEESFAAMIELTKRFTSEFAIRPFLEASPGKVFPRLLALTTDPSEDVRRWCSEGTRTRLPWGRKLHALIADPEPIWPILEALRDDESKYVQKSVANNLNDLAKDHPEAVIARCRAWMKNATPQRSWIVKHALRTLIKDGHPDALAVIGIHPPEKIAVNFRALEDEIRIGDSLTLAAELTSSSDRSQSLVIDFAVHYVRKGNKVSEKVFKWKPLTLEAGESVSLEKRHAFKQTSIRALYPGEHRVEIQINGERLGETSFRLLGEGG
ncbi:MAG: DNA alkylation repair protein [Verrucomicrobiota bacterium]